MNEDMKVAWLEISQMLGEPTREELDVFLRTWQRASQATREALAEQPAQTATYTCGVCGVSMQMEQPTQQEPVAWIDPKHLEWLAQSPDNLTGAGLAARQRSADMVSLYTSPPAQRKPLTDEQLMAIGKELGLKCRFGGNPNIDFDYARAIEAAHGIKENT